MRPSLFIFLAVNLVGLLLCIDIIGGIESTAKMEERDYYDFGDSILFLITAVPVFLICSLVNIFWGAKALIEIFRRKNYHSAMIWGAAVLTWAAVFLLLRQTA
jgi:hypothetical protein